MPAKRPWQASRATNMLSTNKNIWDRFLVGHLEQSHLDFLYLFAHHVKLAPLGIDRHRSIATGDPIGGVERDLLEGPLLLEQEGDVLLSSVLLYVDDQLGQLGPFWSQSSLV